MHCQVMIKGLRCGDGWMYGCVHTSKFGTPSRKLVRVMMRQGEERRERPITKYGLFRHPATRENEDN